MKGLLFTGGIFLLRRGWNSPLLGFADAFSVGGFLLLVSGCLHFFRSDTFDGFAYAARSALCGFFPAWAQPYSRFKRTRKERRGGLDMADKADGQAEKSGTDGAENAAVFGKEERRTGAAFLLVGLALCAFFL